jgi:hypothetical protein
MIIEAADTDAERGLVTAIGSTGKGAGPRPLNVDGQRAAVRPASTARTVPVTGRASSPAR